MRHFALIAASALVVVTGASASSAQSLPAAFTVPNDAVQGPVGITFTLNGANSSTLLDFTVSGEPFLQPNNTYGTNAAGVVTTAGSASPSPIGSSLIDPSSGFTYGSLLATFNGQTVQVFPTTVANGLNSMMPSNSLSYVGTIGQLFSTSSGTIFPPVSSINFRIDDSGYGDNSGAFTIVSNSAVPEPATWAMMLIGFGMIGFGMRYRRKNTAAKVSFA